MFTWIKQMQETFDYDDGGTMVDYADQMSLLSADYNDLIHSCWKQLMGLEITLFDQIEEANLKFERVLTDLVNSFIEQAQELFTICRNLECGYLERVNESALKLQSILGTPEDFNIDPEIRPVSILLLYVNNVSI